MVSLTDKSIKPKHYKQIIGFTWSPDENLYSTSYVCDALEEACKYCADYTVYPEYRDSERKTGLHYHGIVKIYDKYKWFKRGKGWLNEATNMKPRYEFRLTDAWYTYIKKDQNLDPGVTNLNNN